MELKQVLSASSGTVPLGFQEIYGQDINFAAITQNVFWEVKCVDHNISFDEVLTVFLVPSLIVLVVSAVVVTAILAPESLPDICEGLSKPAAELLKMVIENSPKPSEADQKKSEGDLRKVLAEGPTVCIRIRELADAYTDPELCIVSLITKNMTFSHF